MIKFSSAIEKILKIDKKRDTFYEKFGVNIMERNKSFVIS